MGAEFSVINDRRSDFKILRANIYTPSQGLCCQRLKELNDKSTFVFDEGLGYGSFYDVEIVGINTATATDPKIERYRRRIYLKYGLTMTVTQLTREKYRDNGSEWKCKRCKKENQGSGQMCEHCHTNKAQSYISALALIPIGGIPFSITDSTLKWGRATQSHKRSDVIDATVATVCTVIDIALLPFIVNSMAKIPVRVAAETGVKLTMKTAFTSASAPLAKEFGNVLSKSGAVTLAKGAKSGVAKLAKNLDKDK